MEDQSSRYDPLGQYLAALHVNEITLPLSQIAELVGPLPSEANRNQFWANVDKQHGARRRQWLGNGFRAYFNRSSMAVRFVKEHSSVRANAPWTDAELRVCVLAYKRLWDAEQRAEKLDKSELRREARSGDLSGRTEGAYEFRMQNISALLYELGLPFVRGYLPRRNVGNPKSRLISLINEVWQREAVRETPTSDLESLATRVIASSEKLKSAERSPPSGTNKPEQVFTELSRYVRDPEVIAWVLLRAGGHCEACRGAAPFLRSDGSPFLEVHHLRPLSEGGPDVVTNVVAVCPNCHRRLHHSSDRIAYRRLVLKREIGLLDWPKRRDG